MSDHDDFERDPIALRLRRSLAEHARQAPSGDFVAERILYAADRESTGGSRARRRGWRTWTLPLVAAGSVAAVVGAVIAVQNYHPHSTHIAAPVTRSAVRTPSPTPNVSTRTTATNSATSVPPNTSELHGVEIVDLTFYSQSGGWALATSDCVGTAGRCTALLHTTSGTSWASVGHETFNVPGIAGGCTAPCVRNIRFATARTGYAFGPHALFMTNDGGASWQQQHGGAIFLESLSGNVIRVTSTGTGCPLWCNVEVQTSSIGSELWTPVGAVNAGNRGYGIQFARDNAGNAYLLFLGHTAGGGQNAKSALYRSSDNGRTWTAGGEPCPQNGQEVDSYTIAAGGDGRVSVLCATRTNQTARYVATWTDGGANFTAHTAVIPGSPSLLAGDPSTVLVGAGDEMARSTTGGVTWTRVTDVTGPISFVGFESPTNGRAVGNGGHTIYTTSNAGATWTAFPLP